MSVLWLDVQGYEGRYQVSSEGQVRNAAGRILSPNKLLHGYLTVHLYRGGKSTRKVKCVHRLVAEAFVQGKGDEVNHLNFNRADNRAKNLAWCTRLQNVAHTIENGRQGSTEKPVKGVSLDGQKTIVFNSQVSAETYFRGNRTGAISRCLAGKIKSAYGFKWSRI